VRTCPGEAGARGCLGRCVSIAIALTGRPDARSMRPGAVLVLGPCWQQWRGQQAALRSPSLQCRLFLSGRLAALFLFSVIWCSRLQGNPATLLAAHRVRPSRAANRARCARSHQHGRSPRPSSVPGGFRRAPPSSHGSRHQRRGGAGLSLQLQQLHLLGRPDWRSSSKCSAACRLSTAHSWSKSGPWDPYCCPGYGPPQ